MIVAEGDADVDIERAVVNSSQSFLTTVVGEDTDLLVLVPYYGRECQFPLLMRSDIKGNRDNIVHYISRYRMKLGTEISTYMLFLHTFTSCDSTSRISSISKQAAFTRFINSNLLQEVAKVFSSESKHYSEIERAGNNSMVALFRGTPEESSNELRHRILLQKVTSAKSFVVPERLPSIESATRFHSYRSYYQIMVWNLLDQGIHATDLGWILGDSNKLVPVMTDMSPASELLLKVIH